MIAKLFAAALAVLVAFGCNDQPLPTGSSDAASVAPASSDGPAFNGGHGPVVNRVSVGGADVCVGLGLSPGCDANFSLIALEHADGSVSGNAQDSFGGGPPPFTLR